MTGYLKKVEELESKVQEETDNVDVPDNLKTKVEKLLKDKPQITWHRAVQLIADPDAPEDDDADERTGDDDDEDLTDIDE